MFTLDQAISAINGRKEFAVKQRPYGTVIDYNIELSDTFVGRTAEETQILLNLRGTIFDTAGKIIRLSYHKFKNINQSVEYQAQNFDLSQPHVIQEKLDGSMIAPFPVGTIWEFGTRAGITDVSKLAQSHFDRMLIERRFAYQQLIVSCLERGQTPIFEYCSRENRVVIDYPVSKLVLTAIRDNATGEYLSLKTVNPLIEVVKEVKFRQTDDLSFIANKIASLTDSEGVVIKFADGRMVKIKAELYCLQHRTRDSLRQEKDVLRLILRGQLDDVLGLLSPDAAAEIQRYSDLVLRNVRNCERQLRNVYLEYRRICEDRKAFAALATKNRLGSILFSWYSGKSVTLTEYLLDYCTSQTRVDEVRWILGAQFKSGATDE